MITKPMPRAITAPLLANVQALYQNRQIDLKEKNEITDMIRKGLTEGYDALKEKLKYLDMVVDMNFLTAEMLDMISGKNQQKEDVEC